MLPETMNLKASSTVKSSQYVGADQSEKKKLPPGKAADDAGEDI
jgi:hypothetical protein